MNLTASTGFLGAKDTEKSQQVTTNKNLNVDSFSHGAFLDV